MTSINIKRNKNRFTKITNFVYDLRLTLDILYNLVQYYLNRFEIMIMININIVSCIPANHHNIIYIIHQHSQKNQFLNKH